MVLFCPPAWVCMYQQTGLAADEPILPASLGMPPLSACATSTRQPEVDPTATKGRGGDPGRSNAARACEARVSTDCALRAGETWRCPVACGRGPRRVGGAR
eukprot:68004-Chlamydomonas_euryale.AAC.1